MCGALMVARNPIGCGLHATKKQTEYSSRSRTGYIGQGGEIVSRCVGGGVLGLSMKRKEFLNLFKSRTRQQAVPVTSKYLQRITIQANVCMGNRFCPLLGTTESQKLRLIEWYEIDKALSPPLSRCLSPVLVGLLRGVAPAIGVFHGLRNPRRAHQARVFRYKHRTTTGQCITVKTIGGRRGR